MPSLLVYGALSLSLVQRLPGPFAQAFNPNCTLPFSSTPFVAAPNTRGTLSILWNCLCTIILCTWNIQHLNIPSSRPYYDKAGKRVSFLRRLWWTVLDMRTNLKWMLLTVLVPEYIMGRALSERLAATSSLGTLRLRFGDEMELIHAYIMNMGGYYLDFSEVNFFGVDLSNVQASGSSGLSSTVVDYSGIYFSNGHIDDHSHQHGGSQTPNLSEKDHSNTGTSSATSETLNLPISKQKESVYHGPLSEAKFCTQEPIPKLPEKIAQRPLALPSIATKDHDHVSSKPSEQQIPTGKLSSFQTLNLARFKHDRWALTALQLLNAKMFKLYDSLPPVSPQELESLNKSDSLVKLLAMFQIGWLIIQLIVRYQYNIISSQLEISALAFSVCSLLTYAILWNRPRGVTKRYRIEATKAPKLTEVLSLATFGPGYVWTWHRFEGTKDEEFFLLPIPNDASHAVDVRSIVAGYENTVAGRTVVGWLRHNHPAIVSVIVGSALGGTLFGGVHCLAWNFAFPTYTELVLWRVCSVMITILPMLSVYFNLQWSYYNGWVENLDEESGTRLYGPILLIFFAVPYTIARLFLLLETFRSLFFLPPEAFIDTWPGAFLLWG